MKQPMQVETYVDVVTRTIQSNCSIREHGILKKNEWEPYGNEMHIYHWYGPSILKEGIRFMI